MAAVLAMSCSSGSSGEASGSSPAEIGSVTHEAGGDSTPADAVLVVLREWTVDPGQTNVAAGSTRFLARNAGTRPHQLTVVRADVPPERLPRHADGSVDVGGAGVDHAATLESVAPGETRELVVELGTGNYYLLCNQSDADGAHVAHRMFAPFTVG